MKKIVFGLIFGSLILFLSSTTLANNCKQVEFSNGRVCVDITKKSNSIFEIKTNIEHGNGTLQCTILFSNNTLEENNCNEEFLVGNPREQRILLFIQLGSNFPIDRQGKPNNKPERIFPQWMYDFNIGEWSNGGSSTTQTTQNFLINSNITSPNLNQRVDLTINTRDRNNNIVKNYVGTINFEIYYKVSGSNSRTKTTSSTFFDIDNYYQNGYTFKSSDQGIKTLNNIIRFKRNYDFKVRVIDKNNSSVIGERIFYLENQSTTNINNFLITTNKPYPNINERTNLTVRARNLNNSTITNYDGTVNFEVYYRLSPSDQRRYTSSSTLFEIGYNYRNGYKFDYYDGGEVNLNNIIKFKRDYDFKVRLIDKNNSSAYGEQIFYIGDNYQNENINNFDITTNNSSPTINERINLTVRARNTNNNIVTNYVGSVDFEVFYRTSSNNNWIKTTSSTFFDINSSYQNGYLFRSYDYGEAILNNFIRFKRDYDFKVRVIDRNNSSVIGERIFYTKNQSTHGFTTQEIKNITSVYNIRDLYIQNLKNSYSKLRNNQTRINMSNDLKNEMGKIIYNSNDKKYNNWDQFKSAFNIRYSYTISNR